MTLPVDVDIVNDLHTFYNEMSDYYHYRMYSIRRGLKKDEQQRMTDSFQLIRRKAGWAAPFIAELIDFVKAPTVNMEFDVWSVALRLEINVETMKALDYCMQITSRAIGKLEFDIKNGIRDKHGKVIKIRQLIGAKPPKAYVIHGGKSAALTKLKIFLNALGVKYVLAGVEDGYLKLFEKQDKVIHEPCDFAIILGNKSGVINNKTRVNCNQMNIGEALDRAKEKFGDKIIILLETGVKLNINNKGILSERFTPQSMDKAFIKIAKAVQKWRLIKS